MPISTAISVTSSLAVPPTQNTAPVLEFNCLYTHDVRRKTKRWQDGLLRFHTFNKRIMVYDVSRNFVGDMHWTSTEPVHDGDEVKLEKGGVIVQVADQIGQTQTDLTELVKSRHNPHVVHGLSSPLASGKPNIPSDRTPTTLSRSQLNGKPLQQKHRSLNALLGSDRAPLGKAVLPQRSPYEIRQANLNPLAAADARSPKRRRLDETSASSRHAPSMVNGETGVLPAARSRHVGRVSTEPEHDKTPAQPQGALQFSIHAQNDAQRLPIERGSIKSHMRKGLAPNTEDLPGKRLQLVKTAPRRKMLICQDDAGVSEPVVQSHLPQQQRLKIRLANAREQRQNGKRVPNSARSNEFCLSQSLDNDRVDPEVSTPERAASLQETASAIMAPKPADSIPDMPPMLALHQPDVIEIMSSPERAEIGRDLDLSSSLIEDGLSSPLKTVNEDVSRTMHVESAKPAAARHVNEDADAAEEVVPMKSSRKRRAGITRRAIRESAAKCFPSSNSSKQSASMATAEAATNGDAIEPTVEPDGLLAQIADEEINIDNGPIIAAEDLCEATKPCAAMPAMLIDEDQAMTTAEIEEEEDACMTDNMVDITAEALPNNLPRLAPGPWSCEAFDLFTWRPPKWNEEKWCIEAA